MKLSRSNAGLFLCERLIAKTKCYGLVVRFIFRLAHVYTGFSTSR
jgi:hypothetical protein